MRRAPVIGYDHGVKRQYRRRVWKALREALEQRGGKPIADCQALLMPSTEGDEINVALANGFREYNLHIVDENPAIVATLKRRFRRINTYGTRVTRAVLRLREAGVALDCLNLDFTACLGRQFMWDWCRIGRNSLLMEPTAVAVTIQKGREDKSTFDWITKQSLLDANRARTARFQDSDDFSHGQRLHILACLWNAVRNSPGRVPQETLWRFEDQYRTHRVPMCYGVFMSGPVDLMGRSWGYPSAAIIPRTWTARIEKMTNCRVFMPYTAQALSESSPAD